MELSKFKQYYNQLNKEQKLAVDEIEGPVMIVAGPGTGKTQILTLRIANILIKTDVGPSAILALTFTESGVFAMRQRLEEIIGTPAYEVNISTFHGFCNDIIKEYQEYFPHVAGAEHINEVEQAKLMEGLILNADLKYLKPFGSRFHYLMPVLASIRKLKREGVSPDEFSSLIKKEEQAFSLIDDLYHTKGAHKGKMKGDYVKLQNNIAKNQELAVLYSGYQNALRVKKYYDYEDMIMEALAAISKNEDLLRILQEQYQYILVDEQQDTNNAQNKVVELIANFHSSPNVFIVGDEKQAIYRFQGASSENFSYFKKLYPQAKTIALEDNYRSTQAILDSAHNIIQGPVSLRANSKNHNEKPSIYSFSSPEKEHYFIAQDIKNKIGEGLEPGEIAVLVRDNKDMMPLADAMARLGLMFTEEADINILKDADIKKFLMLLKAIKNYGEAGSLIEAMHLDFLKIVPLDIYKIAETARANRINPYDIIRSEKSLISAGVEDTGSMLGFYKNISHWKTYSKNHTLEELLEEVMRGSGFMADVLSGQSYIRLEKVRILFDKVKEFVERNKNISLDDFFDNLDTLKEHNIRIGGNISFADANSVRIMTAHRSKGREFGHVYVASAHDGHWGNKRSFEILHLPESVFMKGTSVGRSNDKNQDERNLFYVALTRAKHKAILTYSREGLGGRQQLPSQFINEIEGLSQVLSSDEYEKKFDASGFLFLPKSQKGPGIKDKDFISSIFAKRGISVTSLNNYLKCPWRYFYTNLVEIPKAKTKHQMYGTAVHASLKRFFDSYGAGQPMDKKKLLEVFKESLDKEPLNEQDYAESLKKGDASLAGYFDNYNGKWTGNVLNELRIKGVQLSPGVVINGQIDKLEISNDGSVGVVDYKTSKPKSRNDIEGKTASSGGDYKRQLVFYNLLLNNYDKGKYKMSSGQIDFVEPDAKGKYKKEIFEIAPREVKDLEASVIKMADEILNLKFWDGRCDDRNCEFCLLREMMV
ncbi:MAG: ATP-dependent DNA helicase [bacterium]|nr:ATP-dependent DNA helicase [bacterium]